MRDLTQDELDLISGGYDPGEDIVVTGSPYHPPYFPPPSYYPPPGYYPPVSPPPYGGGGGGGSPGHSTASHRTASGNTYTYNADLHLSDAQIATLDKVVDYGVAHGMTKDEINIVASDAFYESGLSQAAQNGSHTGLFQYNSTTWSALGESGSINNANDQIQAAFHDLKAYEARYADAIANNSAGLRDAGLTLGQYFEIKHELGNNSTNWTATNPVTGNRYIDDWAAKSNNLSLQSPSGATGGGGSGGGGGGRGGGGNHPIP